MPDKAGKLECTPKEVITEGIMDRVLSANQTSPKYRFMVFRIPNDLIWERGDGASPAVTCTIYVRFPSACSFSSVPMFSLFLRSFTDGSESGGHLHDLCAVRFSREGAIRGWISPPTCLLPPECH